MMCPQLLARKPSHFQQHQAPCDARPVSARAHPRTRQPPTPSPTPLDTASTTAAPPAELTLVETQGRSQTTHTWSLSDTPSTTSSSIGSTSSNSIGSSTSSQEEGSESSSRGSTGPLFLYSQSQQQLSDSASQSHAGPSNTFTDKVSAVRESLSRLFLPAGYPVSVTDDYLPYQLATVPAHITGWLSISLVTSSLLKAVGISAGPVGATAAAAAIKWITKDGIGAAGRLLVGGRLGLEFDDDPRRWRMAAEALTTLGLSLEIATAVYPQQFLLLASLGNFSKAVGKGMGRPVFRVVQTHFAASGNVGAVAAKEEVWEVSAQLTGYALSVMLLQQLQDAGSWQTVVGIWALVQGAHVAFRYVALKTLRFRYLNQKRAKLLVNAHVRSQQLPTVSQGNQQEPFFATAADMAPHITLGCSLAEAWGVGGPSELQPELLAPWWGLYDREGYLLTWQGGRAAVVLKEGVGEGVGRHQRQQVLLRALWQAAWLDAHADTYAQQQQQQQQQHSLKHIGQDGEQQQQRQQHQRQQELALLQASLQAVEQQFESFCQEAQAAGWRADQLVMKVGASRLQQLPPAGSESDGLMG